MRLCSERIVTPQGVVSGSVVVEGGVVCAVERGAAGGRSGARRRSGARGRSAPEVVDLGTRWLVPGFIDVHVHGGDGSQFNTLDPDEIRRVARFHARHGTTSLLATLVPAPVDELVASLTTVRTAMAAQATPPTRSATAAQTTPPTRSATAA
jgi:N-acetylglucosamine-6-phosphate deacetylase